MQDPLVKQFIETLDYFCGTVYFLLTLGAAFSIWSTTLHRLSLHGKTRALLSSNTSANLQKREQRPMLKTSLSSDHFHSTAQYSRIWFLKRCYKNIYDFILYSPKVLVHKRRFLHFYATGILVSSSLFLFYLPPITSHNDCNTTIINLPFVLLIIHLIRRSYECLYVHVWSADGNMHICGYVLGLCHYIFLPFVFITSNVHSWADVKSYPISSYRILTKQRDDILNDSCHFHRKHFLLMIGIILFFFGQRQQYIHHKILSHARQKISVSCHRSGVGIHRKGSFYQIPYGGWFDWISCPHYLAEILIYVSWVLLLHEPLIFTSLSRDLSGQEAKLKSDCLFDSFEQVFANVNTVIDVSLGTLHEYKHISLLLWVVTNLGISAHTTHYYYHEEFQLQYPRHRKKLIPFLW